MTNDSKKKMTTSKKIKRFFHKLKHRLGLSSRGRTFIQVDLGRKS